MSLLPDPAWPTMALAVVMLADAALTARPPAFVRDCLEGVRFPRDWWWTLVMVKLVAAAGLGVGLVVPGTGAAANVGIICYFLAAAFAHLRARFLEQEFWLNCLGMLAVSLAVLLVSYVV